MSYATPADLLARFGAVEMAQLSDRTNLVSQALLETAVAGGDISAYTDAEQEAALAAVEVLQAAVDDASEEIDGYLEGRLELPLARVPRILRPACADMARYVLEGRRSGAVREQVEKEKARWTRLLTDVSRGTMNLGLSSGGEAAVPLNTPRAKAGARAMTADTLKDY